MNEETKHRFARQIVLPGVGEAGQIKLARSHAVIVGCGGLGNPAAAYLAGAGIGTLTLVDGDRVHVNNLHRQVLFSEGKPENKAVALARHCSSLMAGTRPPGPGSGVIPVSTFLDPSNVRTLINPATIVLDCTDDAKTKHLIGDACHLLQKPLVYAAAQAFEGYVALFANATANSPHLRDLYPEPDPTLPDCATTGVLGTAVGIVGMLQANAALCYLLGIGEPPVNTLLTYNALDNRQHRMAIGKRYRKPIRPPWETTANKRAALETDDFEPKNYDAVFTMLDEAREPAPPPGVVRLTKHNPYGQCLDRMNQDGRYLIYCNSGKLSLVLAAQLRKAGYQAYSLRGGMEGV